MATYKKFDKWARNIVNGDFTSFESTSQNSYPYNLYFALTNQLPSKTDDEFIADINEINYVNLDDTNPSFVPATATNRKQLVTWLLLYNTENLESTNKGTYANSGYYDPDDPTLYPLKIKAKSTGSLGPFRYIVFYARARYSNSPYINNPLICYYDYGYSITLNSNEYIIVNFTQLNSDYPGVIKRNVLNKLV